jgi:hypothetical protein
MNLREDGHQIHVTREYVCEQSKLHIQYMQCFFCELCDVAKVAMIHTNI